MPAPKKYATVLAEAGAAADADLAVLAAEQHDCSLSHDAAVRTLARAEAELADIESEAARGAEVDPAAHANAVSAINLGRRRVSTTASDLENATRRVGGRSSDTYLAERVAEALRQALPGVSVFATANPRPPEPPEAERLAVVVVQTHAGTPSPTGEIVGEVEVIVYRTAFHVPFTKEVMREITQTAPGSSTKMDADSMVKQRGLVSTARLRVRVAPEGLPVFDSIAPKAALNLGYELEEAIGTVMHSETDPYRGVPRENERIRFAAWGARITGEQHTDSARAVTVTLDLLCHFKVPSKHQQPLDKARALVGLLDGSFISGLGRVAAISVKHAPPAKDLPPGSIPGPGHDLPGRYVVEATLVSELPTEVAHAA